MTKTAQREQARLEAYLSNHRQRQLVRAIEACLAAHTTALKELTRLLEVVERLPGKRKAGRV